MPIKSSITKVLVPVLIVDNERANDENQRNDSIAELTACFEAAFKNHNSTKTFVSRMAIVEAIQ